MPNLKSSSYASRGLFKSEAPSIFGQDCSDSYAVASGTCSVLKKSAYAAKQNAFYSQDLQTGRLMTIAARLAPQLIMAVMLSGIFVTGLPGQ